MFTERLDELFRIIGITSNSEFARIMGCERAYVSMLRNGKRVPTPDSETAGRVARALRDAAVQKDRIEALCERIGVPAGIQEERLIPAVEQWLLEAQSALLPPEEHKRGRRPGYAPDALIRLGLRLDAVMNLTGLTNAQLARVSGVDASMISRYRQGVRVPAADGEAVRQISRALYRRAAAPGRLSALSTLTEIPEDILSDAETGSVAFHDWLLNTAAEDALLENLLISVDDLPTELGTAFLSPEEAAGDAPNDNAAEYRGIAGLRRAVLRFLGGAVQRQVRELWLYSDQPTDWMTSSPAFALKWTSLMTACIRTGMKIRVIHNVDRGLEEMLTAIRNWLPLYMTGQIESWYSPLPSGERFSRTLFFAPGFACVHACCPAESEKRTYYWYDTDPKKLAYHAQAYSALLSACLPLVHIMTTGAPELLASLKRRNRGLDVVLPTLSLATMPEALLIGMAERAGLNSTAREALFREWKSARTLLHENLIYGAVHELFPLPSAAALRSGTVPVDSMTVRLHYTPSEFSDHMRVIWALSRDHANFRVTVLPEAPFSNTKLVVTREMVGILRLSPPEMAFTIRHPLMRSAFRSYVERLKNRATPSPDAVAERLRQILRT